MVQKKYCLSFPLRPLTRHSEEDDYGADASISIDELQSEDISSFLWNNSYPFVTKNAPSFNYQQVSQRKFFTSSNNNNKDNLLSTSSIFLDRTC